MDYRGFEEAASSTKQSKCNIFTRERDLSSKDGRYKCFTPTNNGIFNTHEAGKHGQLNETRN